MKTNIKIVILSIVCFSFFLGNTDAYANWYGDHSIHTSWYGGWCDEDLQPDSLNPTPVQWGVYYSSDTYERHYTQRRVVGGAYPWLTCQYWDSTNPTAASLTYANPLTNGWTNNTTITLNWSAADTGGSGLKDYDIRVYSVLGAQNNPTASNFLTTITTSSATPTYNYVGLDGYAYTFEVCPRDVALNVCTTWLTSTDVARIDTVVPATADLTEGASNAVHLLATGSQDFNLSFNDTAAPVKVWYRFENNDDKNAFDSLITSDPYAYSYTYNKNISKVDNDRVDGGREVTILIDRICDQAGNCIGIIGGPGIKTFTHYVYANPNYNPTNTQDTSEFAGAVADGEPRDFIQTIKDGYGNALIPALGINRIITMNLSGISNTMFLDQYSRSGTTSVYVTAPTIVVVPDEPLNFGTSQSFVSSGTSSDGKYPFTLKVYTPTANSYLVTEPVSDPAAAFGFTTNLVINDDLIGLSANKTFSQSFDTPIGSIQLLHHFFEPLYTTYIDGNLRAGGFIEGTEQASNIIVTKNNMAVTPSPIELQLEFSGANVGNFDLYGGNTTNSTTPIIARGVMTANPGSGSTDLFTKLVQKPSSTVLNISNLQISTHFAYSLDSKNIIYNSDIIGRDSYHNPASVNLGNQVGTKIIGPIASNNLKSIVDGQFSTETSIFSGLSRIDVRSRILKATSLATRNMAYEPVGDVIENITTLPPGSLAQGDKIDKGADVSILKIEKTVGDITLALTSGITGKRTLVVKGANLYVSKDMFYTDSNSILGVVVQKDKNGNGGNLYIDPNVTNMVGTYIIDGSVMSYDGTNEIGVGNIGILKNQLHIYGSIVSENTLGGSRMSPAKCPSLINTSCTTSSEAQKYDLNYLRRYYLYNGIPFGGAHVIGGAIFIAPAMLSTGFTPNLISKFTNSSEDLAKYPVIIEYNPLIRTNPPIGFEESND